MTTDRIFAKVAAIGVAAFCTLTTLAGIDSLATDQHAGTTLAKAQAAAAKTAAVKASAGRS